MKIKQILNTFLIKENLEEENKVILNKISEDAEKEIKEYINKIVKEVKSHKVKGRKRFSNEEIVEFKIGIINYFETYLNRKL